MQIEERVAVVTGAGSGLGRLLAEDLAALGAYVLIVDVDDDAASAVTARAQAAGGSAEPLVIDLRRPGAVDTVVRRAEQLGGPHLLINNAGGWGASDRRFPDAPPAEWDAVVDLNLRVPMALTQRCLPAMQRAGGGAVVNIASSAGRGTGSYGSPEYAVAKAGLIRLTTSLADLPAAHGVRVNCVVPDWIGLDRAHTELAALSPDQRAAAAPLIPPADVVAAVVRFVLDDRLSGRVVVLDGGQPPQLLPAPGDGAPEHG